MSRENLKKVIIIIICLLFISIAKDVFASFEYGGIKDVGSRAYGMGGAYLAVGSDADMLYWNSACLSKNTRFRQFSISYSRLFLDVFPQGFIGFSTPDKGKGSIGIGGLFLGSTGIYAENMGLLSYSKNLYEMADILGSLGITLKYMNRTFMYEEETIKKETLSNIGFDIGFSIQKGEKEKNLSFSGVYRSYLSKDEDLKDYIRIGLSYTFPLNENTTIVACDYDFPSKGLHFGLETEIISGLLLVRGGYSQAGEDMVIKNYTLGFGIIYMPWRLDYALIKPVDVEIGVIHKFSLDIKF